ncbi:thiamine diphosphokinase [Aurantimonas sp. MSK8Z-1]|uniref:thiamine diphosphokinase n=1 Tax=Mangrovibrevibacter kandeliae TaxID=2968473 RepID=UPI00211944A7|nr:thiamine diphosphokinase [Aurantimonas sp. MSK8Z-1]MCW4113424.1 thiamine diphosphokinase [Aurantimonas sp. MSK8Z-1]
MSCFTILLAGPIRPTTRLAARVAGSHVIAADEGMRHAATLGLTPELWVGDFDSMPPALAALLPPVERRIFPRDKDRTDGELAIEAAIERGATRLILVGAFGGPRSDHAFMHLILALRYAARGIAVTLASGEETGWPLGNERRRFELSPGQTFSVLHFGGLDGLTIAGAKWPLTEVSVPPHSILTLSNEALGAIDIHARRGEAIVVVQEPEEAM